MSSGEAASRLSAILEDTKPWLLSLGQEPVHHRPTPDRWTIAEVVGHLIDSANNNHQRFIRAQEQDSLEFPKYDQNSWVNKAGYDECDWTALVELWYLYNCQLTTVIRKIPSDKFETQCTIGSEKTCTLGFLVTDYIDHLVHHLDKIRERTNG